MLAIVVDRVVYRWQIVTPEAAALMHQRGQGLRNHDGSPCGAVPADWSGTVFVELASRDGGPLVVSDAEGRA